MKVTLNDVNSNLEIRKRAFCYCTVVFKSFFSFKTKVSFQFIQKNDANVLLKKKSDDV